MRGSEIPLPWVTRFAALVPAGGRVLDLACGSGRHTRLFRARGHPVTAIDRDVGRLGALARDAGVTTRAADLEDGSPWPLGSETFAGVVVTHYLWRALLPPIVGAVAPGGVLIYETFAVGNETYGRPDNPDFLLRSGELIEAVSGRLAVVAYEHGVVTTPTPAVKQRICAIRNDAPAHLPA